MDELLFRILSLAATAGFVLGLLQGWLPLLLLSLLLQSRLLLSVLH